METQNVSAQLYFKQLKDEAGSPSSDANIEDSFQKQLDLSEYYKSPGVFETMKRDFMDQTMEGSVSPSESVENYSKPLTETPTPAPKNINVGVRDSLNKPLKSGKSSFGQKSSFGGTMNIVFFILFCIVVYWLYFLIKKAMNK